MIREDIERIITLLFVLAMIVVDFYGSDLSVDTKEDIAITLVTLPIYGFIYYMIVTILLTMVSIPLEISAWIRKKYRRLKLKKRLIRSSSEDILYIDDFICLKGKEREKFVAFQKERKRGDTDGDVE